MMFLEQRSDKDNTFFVREKNPSIITISILNDRGHVEKSKSVSEALQLLDTATSPGQVKNNIDVQHLNGFKRQKKVQQ